MSTILSATQLRELPKAERRRLTIDVYNSDFTAVYLGVPRDRVAHVPLREKQDRAKPFLQCAHYDAHGVCTSDACPNVHANLDGLNPQFIHVNYNYHTIDSVRYDRLSPGEGFEVHAPNNRPPTSHVPRDTLLVTKGSLAAAAGNQDVLSHCAHFYFNRMCNRGQACLYLHVAHIDASVPEGAWAPAPLAIGPNDAKQQHQTPCDVTADGEGNPRSRASTISKKSPLTSGIAEFPSLPCSPGISAAESPVASPCLRPRRNTSAASSKPETPSFRHVQPLPFSQQQVAALNEALDGASPAMSRRHSSGFSAPSNSAPSSGTNISDAEIQRLLDGGDLQDNDFQTPPAYSPMAPRPASTKPVEIPDPVRARIVYYSGDSLTLSQFRHDPYGCQSR